MQVTFTQEGASGDILWRIEAKKGATPENVSALLDPIAPFSGEDEGPIKVSRNGEWYVFASERFDADAAGWPGLVVVAHHFLSHRSVRTSSGLLHGEEPIVTSDGNRVIFVDGGGPHDRDIWMTEWQVTNWSDPILLTGDSTQNINAVPSLSADETRICFDAGPLPYAVEGTGIYEVQLDGSGFKTLVVPADGPSGSISYYACHSGSYAPDGSLVFESEWNGSEQVWRRVGSNTPELIGAAFGNDGSPAVLPDGRIASLWMDWSEGGGGHEIKVMNATGTKWFMVVASTLTPQIPDVVDAGLGVGLLAP